MPHLLQMYRSAYLVSADEIVREIKQRAYERAKDYPGIVFYVSEKKYIHDKIAQAAERKLKDFYEPEGFRVTMIYDSKDTDICTHVLVRYQIDWS